MAAAAKVIEAVLPNVFIGDAHALLMLTYKNELLDIDVRLDAAKAAVRYEKPSLVAVHETGNKSKQTFREWLEEQTSASGS